VVGAGTGDATIFLAEQLRHRGGQVVHLDLSAASIAIAQERARIRGLDNISWVHDSLLNLPGLGLGQFDYISCSGVLHHLADPDLGFKALQSVLAPAGAIGLMVYGKTGRTGVYQVQALMRLVNGAEGDRQRKIANTRAVLASLPAKNWFKRGEDLYFAHKAGDAGIYDLLLHSQDRACSVGELFDWLSHDQTGGGYGKHLEFTDVQRGRSAYLPNMVLGTKPALTPPALEQLTRRQQYEIVELLTGDIVTHSLYVTAAPASTAVFGDSDTIPFFYHEPMTGESTSRIFGASRGQTFTLRHQHSGMTVNVNPGRYGAQLLRLIDGQRSCGEIFALFRADWHGKAAATDDATLFADFAPVYETLNALERLLLKHPDCEGTVG